MGMAASHEAGTSMRVPLLQQKKLKPQNPEGWAACGIMLKNLGGEGRMQLVQQGGPTGTLGQRGGGVTGTIGQRQGGGGGMHGSTTWG